MKNCEGRVSLTSRQTLQKRRRQKTSKTNDCHKNYLVIASVFLVLFGGILDEPNLVNAFTEPVSSMRTTCSSSGVAVALSPEEQALEKTRQHLQKLQKSKQRRTANGSAATSNDNVSLETEKIESTIRDYLRLPANALKEELRHKGLPVKGRKPDLARRLVEYEWQLEHGRPVPYLENSDDSTERLKKAPTTTKTSVTISPRSTMGRLNFCGLKLSTAASTALQNAKFADPTPIQREAIPLMMDGESVILHAATGSGKTLAYLLPITETLWEEDNQVDGYAMILTPTRELAAQVAGVASVLAPSGSVRLITHATDLMSDQRYWKERNLDAASQQEEPESSPRIFIGSAKAMMHSLYGDGKMPASPTRKPAAQEFLSRTRWVVLDEVDRLLLQPGKNKNAKGGPTHEKPAAVVTSAVARRTFGRAQVIAASATVGRTLKREMSRVLGLPPKEFPRVVRGEPEDVQEEVSASGHVGRAVTIPDTVENYVVAVDASSVGTVLTNAFFVLKGLHEGDPEGKRKILMVLTRGCGISTQNAIGALKHFRCQPEPQSLIDELQSADGADQLIEIHRQVSGSAGVGEAVEQSSYFAKDEEEIPNDSKGYLLVTGEDSVRGLHLDGLDIVVVVGRAHGPDEYTHIAGRTGRAGRPGKVINVLSEQHAAAVKGWEKMLDVDFHVLEVENISEL